MRNTHLVHLHYGNFPQGGRSEYYPLREDILRIKRTMLKRLIVPIAFALSLAASNLSAADSPRNKLGKLGAGFT